MKSVRLSAHVKPERYELIIKPDLKGFVFEGEETIFLDLGKAVSEITLHSRELKISEVSFRVKSDEWKVKQIRYNKKIDTVTFKFGRNLPKGKGELKLKFKGVLNDKMRGFYRSRYTHQGKEKHWPPRSLKRPTRGGLSHALMNRRIRQFLILH